MRPWVFGLGPTNIALEKTSTKHKAQTQDASFHYTDPLSGGFHAKQVRRQTNKAN